MSVLAEVADTENPSVHVAVHEMQPEDSERWDQFVLSCPEATFFHRAGWKNVIERAFNHKTWFLYAECNGEIQGVLPLAEIKSFLFGHFLGSLPFCVYGGVAACSDTVRERLELAAIELADKLKVDYLEFRNMKPVHQDWPTKDLYVTFRKTLDADIEKNLLEIPRKQRAMVRKGIKFGLKSDIDEDIERFFFAYSSSVHRLGTPVFSKKYFQLLKQTFAQDCELMTIHKNGVTLSSVMSFYFRNEVLPYYGGGTVEARNWAASDFMYWELMRRSCENGYKTFDFGRSKRDTGSYSFKKNWGFEAQPLHYEYKLIKASHIPNHSPSNPKYKYFIQTWQKLPRSVANWIGPFIVKSLG
ncbi:FemAB-related protein, PEP-CTERM system-associated [Nitrosomonas marina]|uniref:FemAB-related protein, PEP-CTERM system-associated n=1 Tax=Nitrosomonas marina TaxID=917 RepID=A0A1H9Y1F2_9PROT|nr:FemAB-related protein, PEP-CTERM system-associated [Nitrosomonas marina]